MLPDAFGQLVELGFLKGAAGSVSDSWMRSMVRNWNALLFCMGEAPWLCNGCAVFVHKHALALAHASRGGKCKGRGITNLERSGGG